MELLTKQLEPFNIFWQVIETSIIIIVGIPIMILLLIISLTLITPVILIRMIFLKRKYWFDL